jgi:hypothetical protein
MRGLWPKMTLGLNGSNAVPAVLSGELAIFSGQLLGPSSAVVSDLMPHVSWAPLLGRHAALYDLSSSWSGRGRTDR